MISNRKYELMLDCTSTEIGNLPLVLNFQEKEIYTIVHSSVTELK